MANKKPKFNQEMAIRGVNRRLFARSPIVREILEESRQEFPRYKNDGTRAKKNWVKRQCQVCNEWVGSSKIAVDHIDPVVPPEGYSPDLDMWQRITLFLQRLWCDKSNLQRICDTCHDAKTEKERTFRLNSKYSEELDLIELKLKGSFDKKLMLKNLKKYTAKKKTKGLDKIVQRAQALIDLIKKEI